MVLESQKKWRDQHLDYDQQRRQANPKLASLAASCQEQLSFGSKAFRLRGLLLGPKLGDLDKNNLASAQILILLLLTPVSSPADPS